ncbi:MAG: threonylcarbamoyl-AMP synthase [Treponema sp.]|jgi:L-threonylcarbamoyladenylate synthase|nr:threonylcarbamoyl-AMP synthase [Treponema sp.]
MRLLPATDENIKTAAALLAAGGLVAFPTETVYGLGGAAFNPAALVKIFAAKNRPRFDPLIIHIAAPETLDEVGDLSLLSPAAREMARLLTRRFWPGPLTLILPKRRELPDLATSGLPTVAVRFPDHPAAQKLIRLSGTAVAAPSANPFGYLSPTRAGHVREQLGERVDIILDGGPARVGLESTVLDLSGGPPRILRPGGLPKEEIEALIGPVAPGPASAGSAPEPPNPRSPGQLDSHYAPRTGLRLCPPEELAALPYDPAGAYLFFGAASRDRWLAGPGRSAVPPEAGPGSGAEAGEKRPAPVRTLSETGDLTEAAANLFGLLHELDALGCARIYAEQVRGEGLGSAINDRLFRAAAKRTP